MDFLEFVLADFGIPPAPGTRPGMPQSKSGMLMQLNKWLIERFRNGELCAIVVDEAQNLSWELLEEIRLLTNLETSSEKLVQIVLSGSRARGEASRSMCSPASPAVSLWCRTRPLTNEETKSYIAKRLRTAGASQPIFSPEAVEVVHHYSKGIPRLINLICEHAMISAYVNRSSRSSAHCGVSQRRTRFERTTICDIADGTKRISGEHTSPTISGPIDPAADSADSLKDSDL